MFRLLRSVWVFALAAALVPLAGQAAYNDVQFTADTNLELANGDVVVAESGGAVESLTVNAASIEITISSGSSITLRSDARRQMTLSPGVATLTCGSTSSSFALTGGASLQTITLTVEAGSTCTAAAAATPTPASTTGRGGGLPPRPSPPTAVAASINDGAAQTASRTVTLTLQATNAVLMLVSNFADFHDAPSWVPYRTSLPWTLREGTGEQSVFVKFRSPQGGESAVVSDAIQLTGGGAGPVAPPPGVALTEGSLVKEAGALPIYRMENGVLRWLPSPTIFLAHGHRWQDVRTVASLAGIPRGEPYSLSTSPQPRFTLPLRRGVSGPQVYALQLLLQTRGYFPTTVPPTGYFGPVTTAAVEQFQSAHGLPVVGSVGPQTRAVLNQLSQ
ncbi:MAG: putative peptidoglycan-binding domain-containing protein [Parcubacteria group bacterium Gr01-1014_31]|nr:MAG: putative peptidoglycan-binding domain-containing protein [Parcubacteria group bacterium Gr01-1014_31]